MTDHLHVKILRDDHGNVIGSESEYIELDLSGHLAHAEQQAIADHNDAIKAQLREADIAMLRALYEGDTARIAAHKASQAELREKLR